MQLPENEGEQDIVIACCRDEEDIISDFIDFYLDMGFDKVCLIDNGSKDNTVGCILNHPKKDQIVLYTDSRSGYDKRLLEYYNIFQAQATRWCFFIDVDEFIVVPGGIKQYAAALPEAVNVLRLSVAEMLPDSCERDAAHPLLRTRRQAQFQTESKVVWKRGGVGQVYAGKHRVDKEDCAEHQDPALFVRHFHSRSKAQFASKLRNRIDTDQAISEEDWKRVSVFSQEATRNWIQFSHRMLGPNGWAMERKRLARIPGTEDTTVRDWYLENQQRRMEGLDVTPAIRFRSGEHDWLAFSMRDFMPQEGHTVSDHFVLVYQPGLEPEDFRRGILSGKPDVLVRMHSECLFGDVFGNDRCDCRPQLQHALDSIVQAGGGVLIYLRQEGRGIGLYHKIRSLTIEGLDTFARNEAVGVPADARGYTLAARVLSWLGVESVCLMSGNPRKLDALTQAGIPTQSLGFTTTAGISQEAYTDLLSKLDKGYSYEIVHQDVYDTLPPMRHPAGAFVPRPIAKLG